MKRSIAKHVARVGFQASADIGNLIYLLKKNCSQDEYDRFSKAISAASAEINIQIINMIFQDFPDLKDEFDKDVELYGRIL